jgi:hypothetical protein
MTKRNLRRKLLLFAALMIALPAAATAQDAQFAPVTMTFDGTDALSFAPPSALDINGAGTVEMWVQAKWQGNAGYDPAILSYQGPSGPRLAALLTGDAKALGVYAGQFYDKVPYDFSDGELHHVALIVMGEQIMVMIDGEVRDTLGFGMAEVPANDFTIGSLGGYSPFIGEIGQIRIWDEPLDPETVADFAWRPIAADGPNAHPDIASLAGVSTFADPETGGFVFFGPSQDADVTADEEAPIDDGELGLDDPELHNPE